MSESDEEVPVQEDRSTQSWNRCDVSSWCLKCVNTLFSVFITASFAETGTCKQCRLQWPAPAPAQLFLPTSLAIMET